MLKIETRLDPYEIEGRERTGLSKESDALSVKAHWNRSAFVILEWRGHSITVLAKDLKRAIDNATNHD